MTKPNSSTQSLRVVSRASPRSKRAAKHSRVAVSAAPNGGIDEPPSEKTAPKAPTGKLGMVVAMLARPEGATVAQISAATDWQAHSVRGAFAGALKKKHSLTIVSQAAEGGRVYRLGEAGA